MDANHKTTAGPLKFETISLPGGRLRWCPTALDSATADRWLGALESAINWRSEQLHMFGRQVTVPRLIAWYGDDGATYRYSGVSHQPEPWNEPLTQVRTWLAAQGVGSFNSVLANLYRGGDDAMGWHADNETELGPQPLIASISLGATRRMRFRPAPAGPRRPQQTAGGNAPAAGQSFHLDLPHGSLLLMEGQTQQHWQHAITRTRSQPGPRINLTFRTILSSATSHKVQAE